MSKKKKVIKNKTKKPILIDLHMYGIFDSKRNTIIKISLDEADIQMEIALAGGLKPHLQECEFDITLKF